MASSTSKDKGKRPVSVDDDFDIDELDDVLDDFAKKPSAKPTPQHATTSPLMMSTAPSAAPGPPDSSTESDDEAAEFANELARQIEDTLRRLATALDLSGSSGGPSASGSKSGEETDPQKSPSVVEHWQAARGLSDLAGDRLCTAEDFGDPFQTRVKAAMERLHLSDTGPPGDASEDPNDDLAAFLGEDESMQNFLENMMKSLDVQGHAFTSYLASNEGKLSESEEGYK
ncbi:hypothetical protein BGW80DRAFT_1463023 [Lactifluus volemus]|nr:hypothetical protein BGW80DRAFT_1463023 [Lactifluus volemus]